MKYVTEASVQFVTYADSDAEAKNRVTDAVEAIVALLGGPDRMSIESRTRRTSTPATVNDLEENQS